MLGDILKIKSGKKELRSFGFIVGGVLMALGALAIWRGKAVWPNFMVSGVFLVAGAAIAPGILLPFQKAWMALGIALGFFVSHIVLAALYYLAIAPISIILRLIGKDILDQKIDRTAATYWKRRDPAPRPKESYENQY